jgi:WhiB family redox-sensing transcriptional regulator
MALGGDSFRQKALCTKRHIDLWYPPLDTDVPERYYTIAREVCKRCPVWRECLDEGIEERWGMWGGLTPQERTALNNPSPRPTVMKPHGTWTRYRQGCRCNECVDAEAKENEKINLDMIPYMTESLGDLEMLKYGLLSPKDG